MSPDIITPITILSVLIFLYAVVWHDQPARNPERASSADNGTRPGERLET